MKNRIQELDALRGIAALMVVLFHFTMDRVQATYGFNLGATGVDLFFIISGFVILMTIEKCQSWKDFVVSRFSRLFPAYWTAVTFTGCLMAVALFMGYQSVHNISFVARYLGNMTMLQYYMAIPDIDGPYWTLIIELLFYVLMLGLLVTKTVKSVEKIGTVLLSFVLVFSCSINLLSDNAAFISLADDIPLLKFFPLFFSGILIYKMKFEKPTAIRFMLLAACYFIQLSLFSKCYNIRGFMSFEGYALMVTIYYCTFLLFLFNKLGFVVNTVTKKLGKISYSLYLIHQFVSIKIILPTAMKYGLNFWLAALTALTVSVSLALLINKFVEEPSLFVIRKWYKKVGFKTIHAAQEKEVLLAA